MKKTEKRKIARLRATVKKQRSQIESAAGEFSDTQPSHLWRACAMMQALGYKVQTSKEANQAEPDVALLEEYRRIDENTIKMLREQLQEAQKQSKKFLRVVSVWIAEQFPDMGIEFLYELKKEKKHGEIKPGYAETIEIFLAELQRAMDDDEAGIDDD